MREKELVTRVIFVRHGETDFPLDRIYCDGHEEPALNGSGIAQASQASGFLRGWRVDALYASPCLRTRMTAEAIAASHEGLRAVFNDALRERHFGVWEGLYFNEIESRFPAEYRLWKQDQSAFKPEGGESVYDLARRVVPEVKEIVASHRGGTAVIVAHVGPIRVLVAEALGMPVELYRSLRIDPASITVVDYGFSQNNLILLNFHARHGFSLGAAPCGLDAR